MTSGMPASSPPSAASSLPNAVSKQPVAEAPTYSFTTKMSWIIFYGVTSAAIIYFNKIVLSIYNFKYMNTLLLGQSFLTFVLIEMFSRLGQIDLPKDYVGTIKKIWPLTFFFTADILLGMAALRLVNIPMFTMLRRLSIMMVLILEYAVLHEVPSRAVVMSVTVALFGAVIAGAGDLSFDMLGYLLAMLANLTTGAYRVLIKKLQLKNLNSFALMYYNSLLAMPFVLVLAYYTGEIDQLASYEYTYDVSFQICFFTSCALAFLLNYSMFRCTMVNSALTTSVTGQTKNVATSLVGFFAFGDVKYHPLNVLGHVVGTLGGFLYFHATLTADPKKAAPSPVSPPPSTELHKIVTHHSSNAIDTNSHTVNVDEAMSPAPSTAPSSFHGRMHLTCPTDTVVYSSSAPNSPTYATSPHRASNRLASPATAHAKLASK